MSQYRATSQYSFQAGSGQQSQMSNQIGHHEQINSYTSSTSPFQQQIRGGGGVNSNSNYNYFMKGESSSVSGNGNQPVQVTHYQYSSYNPSGSSSNNNNNNSNNNNNKTESNLLFSFKNNNSNISQNNSGNYSQNYYSDSVQGGNQGASSNAAASNSFSRNFHQSNSNNVSGNFNDSNANQIIKNMAASRTSSLSNDQITNFSLGNKSGLSGNTTTTVAFNKIEGTPITASPERFEFSQTSNVKRNVTISPNVKENTKFNKYTTISGVSNNPSPTNKSFSSTNYSQQGSAGGSFTNVIQSATPHRNYMANSKYVQLSQQQQNLSGSRVEAIQAHSNRQIVQGSTIQRHVPMPPNTVSSFSTVTANANNSATATQFIVQKYKYQKLLEEKSSECESLSQQLQETIVKLKNTEEAVSRLSMDNQDLRVAQESSLSELEKIRVQVASVEQTLQNYQSVSEYMTKQKQSLQNQLNSNYGPKLYQMESRVHAYEKQNESLNKSVKEKDLFIQSLLKRLDQTEKSYESQISQLNYSLQTSSAAHFQVEKERLIQKYTSIQKDLEEQVSALQESNEIESQRTYELIQEVSRLRDEIGAREKAFSQLQSQSTILYSIENQKVNLEEQLKSCFGQIADLEVKKSNSDSELMQITQQFQSIQAQYDDQDSQFGVIIKENQRLNILLNEKSKEIEQFKNKSYMFESIKAEKQRLEVLYNEVCEAAQDIQEKNNQLKVETEKALKIQVEKSHQVESWKSRYQMIEKTYISQIEDLKKQTEFNQKQSLEAEIGHVINNHQNQIAVLQIKLRESDNQIREYEVHYESLQKERNQLLESYNQRTRQFDQLRTKGTFSEQERSVAEEKIRVVSREVDVLKSRLNSQQEEIQKQISLEQEVSYLKGKITENEQAYQLIVRERDYLQDFKRHYEESQYVHSTSSNQDNFYLNEKNNLVRDLENWRSQFNSNQSRMIDLEKDIKGLLSENQRLNGIIIKLHQDIDAYQKMEEEYNESAHYYKDLDNKYRFCMSENQRLNRQLLSRGGGY